MPGSVRVLAGAAVPLVCLGAVAYAAAPRGGERPPAGKPAAASLPRPAIVQHPEKVSTSSTVRFGFTANRRLRRFQCRFDRGGWRACRTPALYAKLAPGRHSFAVRGLDKRGRRSTAARFRWRLLEPKDFSIEPHLDRIGALYPGAPALWLPVTITNPNPVPILVTSLEVAATADPPGCARAANLFLAPASLSGAVPLRIPAGGSASLPAPGISPPAIGLRDLPVNQDACQGASFPLAFSGRAHG